jgi:hypothetical protein
MVVFFLFSLIIAFILYFTVGTVLSDLRKRRLKLSKNYQNVLKLVSAGSPEKAYSEANVCLQGSYFVETDREEEEIDENKYELLVVDGNSMSRFGIKDGQIIFVDCEEISHKYPIFVLRNIVSDKENNIKYKLRKFIDFYDCIDDSPRKFNVWIENHPELDAEKLNIRYNEEKEVIAECNRLECRLLISETTRKGESYYSFHPENRIYGAVKYILPKNKVEVIEKR